jgi:hypothetical protein
MSVYQRPEWPHRVFSEGPPPGVYSVETHLERFAPLHLVAEALIEHLAGTYDVVVGNDPAHVADFIRPTDVVRVTRVAPTDPVAAPLTFGFIAHPGVILHAGLLHDFIYPACGCDACDETAADQAEQLEWQVLAVAAGHYRESYTPDVDLPLSFSLQMVGDVGTQGGRSQVTGYSTERLAAAGERLRELPGGGWARWPSKD